MDNPGEAKYGFTKDQIIEGFMKPVKSMGAKYFGIHAFLASNTISNDYYPTLAGDAVPAGGGSEGKRPAATSRSSTCPAAWASPIGRSSRKNDIAAIGAGVQGTV